MFLSGVLTYYLINIDQRKEGKFTNVLIFLYALSLIISIYFLKEWMTLNVLVSDVIYSLVIVSVLAYKLIEKDTNISHISKLILVSGVALCHVEIIQYFYIFYIFLKGLKEKGGRRYINRIDLFLVGLSLYVPLFKAYIDNNNVIYAILLLCFFATLTRGNKNIFSIFIVILSVFNNNYQINVYVYFVYLLIPTVLLTIRLLGFNVGAWLYKKIKEVSILERLIFYITQKNKLAISHSLLQPTFKEVKLYNYSREATQYDNQIIRYFYISLLLIIAVVFVRMFLL